jgi:hypothetical protein
MEGSSGAMRRVVRACVVVGVVSGAFALPGGVAAADSCPNAAVRAQQKATALPDCRAYELVNPPTDDASEVNRVPSMADDGNAVAYMTAIPSNIALGGGVAATSVAHRTASGWVSISADPVSHGSIYGTTGVTGPKVFSPDFTRELIITTLPVGPSDIDASGGYYRLDVGLGTSTLMNKGAGAAEMFGATANLDRVVFRATSPTTNLYASDGINPPELLSVYPDGTPLGVGQATMAGAAYQRGLGVGAERDAAPWVERGGNHAASDDTRRVYFYDSFANGTGFLYVHDHETTYEVSMSARAGDVGTMHRASFISASHDGAVAYFESPDQLTDAATPGGGIYRFDLASKTLMQITPDAGDPTGLHLAGAISSDDQSHVYFTSTAALGGGSQTGDTNAYVWTSGDGVRFIAKVAGIDKFVRVTPDGRYALVLSSASVGGARNNGHVAVYRYDAVTRQTVCVSCRADGSPSNGSADIDLQSPGFPGSQLTHGRALTFDGRVVFTSTDRIVPEDRTSGQDVYLYDKGAVSLLTKGMGDTNSYVGDISDDGRNIFIYTRSALVGADRDAEEFDIYDVRVDGGFLEPPPAGDRCHVDDCQTSSAPAPDKYVSSSSRPGAGNAVQRVVKRLSLARVTSTQQAVLARTGRVVLGVRVAGGGRLSVRGRGRIAGRIKTLGSGSASVLKEADSTVRVTFRLSAAARRELSRRHRLGVRLQARLSGLSKVGSVTVTLTSGAHR